MISWLISCLFAVFAWLSFLLVKTVEDDLAAREKGALREPDYYLESMIRTTTGVEGGVKNILRSRLVEHYPEDDSMELDKPHFEIYNDGPIPWHIVSEKAWVSSGNEIVLLQGKVDVWKTDNLGKKVYEIFTSEVKVIPKDKFAETDMPAKIIGPSSKTDSVGMKVRFLEGRLELMDRVRTIYEKKD